MTSVSPDSLPLAAQGGPGRPVVIRPRRGWVAIDLPELWRYRDLIGFLALRDLRVRYEQSLLGAAWAVLQPLVTMVVFTLLFDLCRAFVSHPEMTRRDRRLVRADAATRLAALAISVGRRWPAVAARIALVGCRLSARAFVRSAIAVVRGGTNAWHRSPIFVEVRP